MVNSLIVTFRVLLVAGSPLLPSLCTSVFNSTYCSSRGNANEYTVYNGMLRWCYVNHMPFLW